MNKKIGVIISILVVIGAGAKLATSYMGMQRELSSTKITQLLGQSELQKAKNQVSAVFKIMESKNYQLAIDRSNELIEKYKNHSDPKVQILSLIALSIRAENYAKLSQFEEAEKDFNNFIKKAGNNLDLKDFVTSAQIQKILMQVENDLLTDEEGIEQIDQYLAKYGKDNSLQLKNMLMIGVKGSLERRLKLFSQATVNLKNTEEELVKILSVGTENSSLLLLLGTIRLEQAEMLAEQGETELAFELLANTKAELESNTDENSEQAVIEAIFSEGYISLINAKLHWNDEITRAEYLEKTVRVLKEARIANEKLTDMEEKHENLAVILADEAYLVYLLEGNEEAAQEKLVEAFTLEGKKLYKGVLRDISFYPIENIDSGYKQLIESAWVKVQEGQ